MFKLFSTVLRCTVFTFHLPHHRWVLRRERKSLTESYPMNILWISHFFQLITRNRLLANLLKEWCQHSRDNMGICSSPSSLLYSFANTVCCYVWKHIDADGASSPPKIKVESLLNGYTRLSPRLSQQTAVHFSLCNQISGLRFMEENSHWRLAAYNRFYGCCFRWEAS